MHGHCLRLPWPAIWVVLGLFRYYGFFAANVAALFAMSDDAIALHIILPLGISFYTFEAISYIVDIYRGRRARA